MTDACDQLLQLIAKRAKPSLEVAEAVRLLCVQGAELGELEIITVRGRDGVPREIKVLPDRWLARVVKAADVGAFDRMSVHDVVHRIMTTDEGVAA
jgi:hypothetical protein